MKYAVSIIVFLIAGAIIFFKYAYLPKVEQNALYAQKIGTQEKLIQKKDTIINNLELINDEMKEVNANIKKQRQLDQSFDEWSKMQIHNYAVELYNKQ